MLPLFLIRLLILLAASSTLEGILNSYSERLIPCYLQGLRPGLDSCSLRNGKICTFILGGILIEESHSSLFRLEAPERSINLIQSILRGKEEDGRFVPFGGGAQLYIDWIGAYTLSPKESLNTWIAG